MITKEEYELVLIECIPSPLWEKFWGEETWGF